MRTNLIKTTTGCLALVSLLACPLVSSETIAMPSRNAFTNIPVSVKTPTIRTQTHPANLEKTTVLAHNSVAKAETAAPASASKAKKTVEKKTISRCWKRLMSMAQEIRHAHSKSSK